MDRCALARRLGVTGLYLFAFSGFVNQGAVYAGLGLMLLGLLLAPAGDWRSLRREPLALLALVLTLYILARGAATLVQWPDARPGKILRDTWDLVAVAGLFSLLAAWWMAGDARRIAHVLQLAMAGLLTGLLMGIDWQHVSTYMAQRPLFGMGNGAGVYSLVAIAGLLLLRGSPLLQSGWRPRRLAPWAGRLALALLLLMMIAVFVLSQTRAAWLAALLVLPAALLLSRARGVDDRRGRLFGFGLVLLGVVVLGGVMGAGVIEKRLGVERHSIALLFDGRAQDVPADSVGLRLRLWEDAARRIGEKSVIGWGAGSARILIGELGLPADLSHYHNLYLQLVVELGLIGLLLFGAWTLGLVGTTVRDWRRRRIGSGYLAFVCASLAIVAITALFQIRHDDERGQYLLILIGALALTHGLRHRREAGVPVPSGGG